MSMSPRPWRAFVAAFVAGLMLACTPAPEPASAPKPAAPTVVPHGAASPDQAVSLLLGHLRRNALADVPRTALPADLHARVEASWRQGRSRWPLTELPLDESIPGMIKALTRPEAERQLQSRFDQQLSGQTRALQEAARGMGMFGKQYLAQQGADYTPQQRQHYGEMIDAVSGWARHAPLGDPGRGREAIHLLVKGAERSGLTGDEDFNRLGMEASLKALVPLYIAFKQMLGLYGLGVDAALAGARAETVRTEGERAGVRLSYTLAGRDIETEVEAVKVDGRWYLADYLKAAEASLGDDKAEAQAAVPEPKPAAGR